MRTGRARVADLVTVEGASVDDGVAITVIVPTDVIERAVEHVVERRLAELKVTAHSRGDRRRISPAEAAARYGRTARWYRDNADKLGGERVTHGPRPRIYFDPATLEERMTACSRSRKSQPSASSVPKPKRVTTRRRSLGTNVDLLPVRPIRTVKSTDV